MTNIIDSFSGEYSFLSNFYDKTFLYKGLRMNTSEHAYQASKCVDIHECYEILMAGSPRKAKTLGQKCKVIENWDIHKVGIMYDILIAKFADKELQEKLLATGDADLIEGNTWGDKFWGICDGEGHNHLGRLLMKVRHHYQQTTHIFDKPNTPKFVQLVYKDPGGPMSFPLDH